MKLIVDANILISALIKESVVRYILKLPIFEFYIPDFSLYEINKNKNWIIDKSKLSEKDFNSIFKLILKDINVIHNKFFTKYHKQSLKIMEKIDKKDSPYIAIALSFQNDGIWSDDKHLKKQRKIKVFTTKELVNIILKKDKTFRLFGMLKRKF